MVHAITKRTNMNTSSTHVLTTMGMTYLFKSSLGAVVEETTNEVGVVSDDVGVVSDDMGVVSAVVGVVSAVGVAHVMLPVSK